jgi:hypothetical protein
MTMELERKQDTSIYFWLKSLFTDAPFINIVDGFPDEELILPTIALEYDNISTNPFELGNKTNMRTRRWYIDIFAVNKSQRDEIGFRILNALESKIIINDYDQGIPPAYSGPWSVLGYLDPENVTLKVSADYLRDNSGGFS